MKVYKLVDMLETAMETMAVEADAEIFIEGEDGLLHDFKIEEIQEVFDGFDSVSPAGYKLIITD